MDSNALAASIPPPPGGGVPVANPNFAPAVAAPPPPPGGGLAVPNPHYAAPNDNSALGTRLTMQSLRNSPAAAVQLKVPANYPVSTDLENRVQNQSTTPPLSDRMHADWELLQQGARRAWTAAKGGDPNAPDTALQQAAHAMYLPGSDAASPALRPR